MGMNESLDLGMCIWQSPADFAGAVMTSSPTWQKRESLESRLSNTLPKSLILASIILYMGLQSSSVVGKIFPNFKAY